MKQVYKIREDGTFDFFDSIVTDADVEGYGEPDPEKAYKEDGSEMTTEEIEAVRNAPSHPTPEQKIAVLEEDNALLALELVETQIRLDQSEQAQADLIFTLVAEGVI